MNMKRQQERHPERVVDVELPGLKRRLDQLRTDNERMAQQFVNECAGQLPVPVAGIAFPPLVAVWKKFDLIMEYTLEERARVECEIAFQEWVAGFLTDEKREEVKSVQRQQALAEGVHIGQVPPQLGVVEGFKNGG